MAASGRRAVSWPGDGCALIVTIWVYAACPGVIWQRGSGRTRWSCEDHCSPGASLPPSSAMPPVGAAGVPRLVWNVSELGESLLTVLFPHLAGLRLCRVEDTGDAVVISASSRAGQACCPGCGMPSSRVHGGYGAASRRRGGRSPAADRAGGARVPLPARSVPGGHVRRQAGGLTERYRRRSVPLLGMLARFGLELAGRPGARWPARWASRCTPLPCCAWSWRCRSRRSPPRRRFSGLMISRCARDTCTGRCWWTSVPGTRWTCCRTARPRPWSRG